MKPIYVIRYGLPAAIAIAGIVVIIVGEAAAGTLPRPGPVGDLGPRRVRRRRAGAG